MSYLSNIDRFSGKGNMGGLLSIQVARKDDFESIPDPVNGTVFGDIVFKAGKTWSVWNVTSETASTDSASRNSREGSSKNNKLPFSIPKYRADIHAMFEQASDDELIVLFKDANGILKLFGLLDSPVKFQYSHNSGSKHADKNEFSGEFYYEGPENMYAYNGTVASPTPGAAPAIVRVNGVVVASLAPGDSINFDTDFSFDFAIVGT